MSGLITGPITATGGRSRKPYVAYVIDCFGFDRAMYGSDWTVSELMHPYPVWVEILDDLVAGASETERRKLCLGFERRSDCPAAREQDAAAECSARFVIQWARLAVKPPKPIESTRYHMVLKIGR